MILIIIITIGIFVCLGRGKRQRKEEEEKSKQNVLEDIYEFEDLDVKETRNVVYKTNDSDEEDKPATKVVGLPPSDNGVKHASPPKQGVVHLDLIVKEPPQVKRINQRKFIRIG